MLTPTFKLTHKKPFTIYRKELGGINEYGEPEEGTEQSLIVEGNLQPLNYNEILLMPESERTKQWYKFYTAEPIRTLKEGSAGWQADEILIDGERYRFMRVKSYQMGILDHYRGDCARIPRTPN